MRKKVKQNHQVKNRVQQLLAIYFWTRRLLSILLKESYQNALVQLSFLQMVQGRYIRVKTILFLLKNGAKGEGDYLAAPWLASSPRSGARAWTGAGSRRRPGPWTRGRTCLSHFLLGVMGRRGRIFCRGGRLGAWSRSSSGLSARPLPVSEGGKLIWSMSVILLSQIKSWGGKRKPESTCSPRGSCFFLRTFFRGIWLKKLKIKPHLNVSDKSKCTRKHPERMNTHSRGLSDLLRWRS